MKRSLCAILIILLLAGVFACCLCNDGNFACAEQGAVDYSPIVGSNGNVLGVSFAVGERTVNLYTVTDPNGQPVGVRHSGYYFGVSGITVVADVYSSDDFVIDFNIGAGDDELTDGQKATRDKLIELFANIAQMIDRVDGYANTTYDGVALDTVSDVYRYNLAQQGETIEIAEETYDMIQLAREMYEVTGGAFNPAVYRLVDLWGFSSRIYSNGNFGLPYDREVTASEFWTTGYPLPDEKYIQAFSNASFTDFTDRAVTLSSADGRYFVTKNVAPAVVDEVRYEQWIDLGGIAKGYAVDRAEMMIAELGIERFYVNAGSSSIATGYEYDGGNTTLGMLDAFDPFAEIYQQSLLEVEIGKSLVSTSGQNIRKYTVDGIEYAHILDGATGAPAQTGVRSVMVVVPQEAGEFWATKGDCLTTALTVMGRDKIVDFVNGYLKDNGIKIVVQYESLDGNKQLLSNYSESEVTGVADSYKEFGWALKQDDNGNYYYDANARFSHPISSYRWILIVLGSLLGAGAVALVIYHFVRGKKRTATNVANAKKDKPFKVLDVMVYLGVVLLILVLFSVFVFDTNSTQLQIVKVIDDDTGETLLVYNVTRGEYTANTDNTNGWKIEVTQTSDGVEVTFTRAIDGETHFNTMSITRGRHPSVEMTDAICGYHKDCVRNFPAITRSGGAIVCSPNRLKIITE